MLRYPSCFIDQQVISNVYIPLYFILKRLFFVAVTHKNQTMKRVIVETCSILSSLLFFRMVHKHQKHRANRLPAFIKVDIDILKKYILVIEYI